MINIKKILKIGWDIFTTLLIILVLSLAVLLGGVRLVGLQTMVVLSGSMEPLYPTGSMIYLKEVETSELEVGDVITFKLQDGVVVTHRIVEVINEGGDIQYRTRGDANDFDDAELVQNENVIGTPVFGIPKLGFLAQYIMTPPGLYVAIFAGAALMLLMFLPDLFGSDEKKDLLDDFLHIKVVTVPQDSEKPIDIRKDNRRRQKEYQKRRKIEKKQEKLQKK